MAGDSGLPAAAQGSLPASRPLLTVARGLTWLQEACRPSTSLFSPLTLLPALLGLPLVALPELALLVGPAYAAGAAEMRLGP